MRFGVSAWGSGEPSQLRDAVRRAEDLGFDVFLCADHLVEGCLPPLLALAVAGEATTSIRLGTFVLNNDLWNPVLLAREAAALDALSGGRFELGLGAGHMAAEYEGTGIPFEPGGARVDRLERSVATIKAALAADDAWPMPAGPLPLLVGGNGRRVHALAAREADIVGFAGFTHRQGGSSVDLADFGPEALDRQVAHVREHAAGRPVELNALVQHVELTDDRQAAGDRLSAHYGLPAEVLLSSPYVCIGSPGQIAEQLLAQQERFGLSYYVVLGPSRDAFAPVIERLHSSSSSA